MASSEGGAGMLQRLQAQVKELKELVEVNEWTIAGQLENNRALRAKLAGVHLCGLCQGGVSPAQLLEKEMQQARDIAALAQKQLEQNQSVYNALSEELERARGRPESPESSSEVGQQTLAMLKRLGNVSSAEGCQGPPILTEQQQAELRACAAGSGGLPAVMRYLAPILQALRLPAAQEGSSSSSSSSSSSTTPTLPLALVDCQQHAWLVSAAAPRRQEPLKPHLMLTWAPFVSAWREAGDGGEQGQEQEQGSQLLPTGRLGSQELQSAGCVAELYQGAAGHGCEEFGRLCKAFQCIPGTCRGALVSEQSCWAYESYNGQPVRLLRVEWTDPGSLGALQGLLRPPSPPPLAQLLALLLQELQLQPLHLQGQCFLGSGASGHVFAVRRAGSAPGAPPLALKLLLACQPWQLEAEYDRLLAAAGKGGGGAGGAPVLQAVPGSLRLLPLPGSQWQESGGGYGCGGSLQWGGFLLSRVGRPLPVGSAEGLGRAFEALAELHASGVYHGDARTANLLEVDGRAVWIDLLISFSRRETQKLDEQQAPSPSQRYWDAETLAKSVLRVLPMAVLQALARYKEAQPGSGAAREAAVEVARVVWEDKAALGH